MAFRAALTLACAFAAPDTHETGLSLVQVRASLNAQQGALPSVNSMMGASSKIAAELESQVAALEKRVKDAQNQNAETLQKQKASYEEKLQNQRAEIHLVEEANTKLGERISMFKISNQEKRRTAEGLRKDSNSLHTELRELQENLTMSRDFATEGLQKYNISGVPELSIMEELAAEDKAKQSQEAEHRRFDGIVNVEAAPYALLQVASDDAVEHDSPKELMSLLGSSFDELASEQESREAALKDQFQKDFAAGEEHHEELLAKQVELNQTATGLEKLNTRLGAAVNHLQETKSFLKERISSLRGFVARLASNGQHSAIKADSAPHAPAIAQQSAMPAKDKQVHQFQHKAK